MLRRQGAIFTLMALAACTATQAPAPGDTAVTSLMSASDRARLQALTAERIAHQSDPDQGYRIGPDDLLEVAIPDLIDAPVVRGAARSSAAGQAVPNVEAAPEFREGLRCSALGDVTIPQLGAVPAEGRTARQLEREIAERLRAAEILYQPEVSVTVVEHRSNVVAVVGSVQRPGLYPLTRPQAAISDMIWAAGGPSADAGRIAQFTPAVAALAVRSADADSAAAPIAPIRIDLDLLQRSTESGAADLNAPVRPGDVINIPPAGIVLVDGWVMKPGSYPVTRNLTLTGTIAAAGGSSFAADRTRATLKRTVGPNEEYATTVDLSAVDERQQADLPIVDGDVVYLPASNARLVPWGIWQFFSNVFRVGASVVAF